MGETNGINGATRHAPLLNKTTILCSHCCSQRAPNAAFSHRNGVIGQSVTSGSRPKGIVHMLTIIWPCRFSCLIRIPLLCLSQFQDQVTFFILCLSCNCFVKLRHFSHHL
jgi:hypothetical protein